MSKMPKSVKIRCRKSENWTNLDFEKAKIDRNQMFKKRKSVKIRCQKSENWPKLYFEKGKRSQNQKLNSRIWVKIENLRFFSSWFFSLIMKIGEFVPFLQMTSPILSFSTVDFDQFSPITQIKIIITRFARFVIVWKYANLSYCTF